jgi:hypothetical protein
VRENGNGTPVILYVNRRPRRVQAIREEWRIDDEWWREPISRRYVTLVLEDGRPLTIYQDLIEGGWYVQQE